MTYFFAEGHIYVILNKLAKLSTKDYNAEGTASMVIKTLCETLGFTKLKLTNVLKHFVYDGGRLSGKFIVCIFQSERILYKCYQYVLAKNRAIQFESGVYY